MNLLVNGGITPILVNTHYLADQVEEFIYKSPFASHIEIVHEQQLLGTGGTLLNNLQFVGDEPIMLIHGDNLSYFNPHNFQRAYEERPDGVEITMMTFRTTTPESCGIVELDNKGIVCNFHEKVSSPPGNLANAAVFILSPSVVKYLSKLGEDIIDFSNEIIPAYLGRINIFHNEIYHRDIGTPESLLLAQHEYPLAVSDYKKGIGSVVRDG